MTKFSSFKDQQLITEGWRTYMVEQQPVNQPPQQQAQQPAQPQDKELQNFQQRQAAVTTVNKDIIAKKAIEYIKTLRGFDLEKNKQVVIDGLTMLIKQLQTPQQTQTIKEVWHYDGMKFETEEDVNAYMREKEEAVFDTQKYGVPADIAPKQKKGIDAAKEILKKAIEDLSNLELNESATLDDGTLVCEACLLEVIQLSDGMLLEAKYQGRTVTLNKPTAGDVKKFKVYVKDPTTGNIKKVNFGDPNMKIKKNIPARRKSFRARHNCANPGPKTKARYWSCKKW